MTPFAVPLPAGATDAPPSAVSADEVDAILIAGDTATGGKHLDFFEAVWMIWRKPVLFVDGNHEGYHAKRLQKLWGQENARLAELRAGGADIEILRGTQRIIGDTRVIGATLWTDQRLYPGSEIGVDFALKAMMNDYRHIQFFDERRGIYRKLIPADTRGMHSSDKQAIYGHLAEPFAGKTVVMTHHLPVEEMLNPARQDRIDLLTAGYASSLAREIDPFKIDAWICGHSHDCVEYLLPGLHGDIRFMRNIRGYVHKGERTDFDPYRILDSNAPRLRCELARHEDDFAP